MRMRLLGTAAGGGVPQWNCNCRVCAAARRGDGSVAPRTQSSAAISIDGDRWFLLNASPDLHRQIEAFPPLQPRSDAVRHSPIEAVLLNSADLDHTLGLLLMREGERLKVHATPAIRDALSPIESLLNRFRGIEWIDPPLAASRISGDVFYQTLPLNRHRVAYKFTDREKSIIYAPDVATLDENLLAADVILFDGTFWSHNEHPRAADMGHVPISGGNGSLKFLAAAKASRKIYIHINNTNPILLENSPERKAVLDAGVDIGFDGMEL